MSFGVVADRGERPLCPEEIESNFADLHEPLSALQLKAEAARCLYCYDAPCVEACPTSIDIPAFIHQLGTANIKGAATTILSQNIMGGTCARACPTEVLCEQSCVLKSSQDNPVEIGLLQRYAVDHLLSRAEQHPFERMDSSGKKIAVIGAGPAGLSCAHRAAMLGHDVVVFEARDKAGGLNEYGLAAYKMVDDFAQKEVAFLMAVGGIEIKYNQQLGDTLDLSSLRDTYDAVFLAVGLADTRGLDITGEEKDGVCDAVDFIRDIRQSADKSRVGVASDVIVVGAGNTAIDAAVQSKCLGAENVVLAYRRGEEHMSATDFEIDLARTRGVTLHMWASPKAIKGNADVSAMEFEYTSMKDKQLIGTGKSFELAATMVIKAIGQKLDVSVLDGLEVVKGKISVNEKYETSLSGVFAGGDCINSGQDLTVQAVQDGKLAAHAIDEYLVDA